MSPLLQNGNNTGERAAIMRRLLAIKVREGVK